MSAVFADTLRLLANEGESLVPPKIAVAAIARAIAPALNPSIVAYLTQFSWTSTAEPRGKIQESNYFQCISVFIGQGGNLQGKLNLPLRDEPSAFMRRSTGIVKVSCYSRRLANTIMVFLEVWSRCMCDKAFMGGAQGCVACVGRFLS